MPTVTATPAWRDRKQLVEETGETYALTEKRGTKEVQRGSTGNAAKGQQQHDQGNKLMCDVHLDAMRLPSAQGTNARGSINTAG